MSEISTPKREGEDDTIATEIIPSRSNNNDNTTRVSPPPIESDSKSTSSGTQKTSTTSRRSNKSKDRSTRLEVVPSSPKKPSFIKQQQNKQRAARRQKQQTQERRLLATTQASTTAMFCPVPWMIPSREPQDKSTRSITSTIPPHQEYLSYQSHEPSECCDSETSGIELGEAQPASPKPCKKPAQFGEASSIQTPPPTTNKARALTPETQAMTEAEDASVSSEASSTSRIDLPRPRALLFEESMRKIEQDTLRKQDELLASGSSESDASTSKLPSPLRCIVFAIFLALLATHGGGDPHSTFVPNVPSIDEPTIPKASDTTAVLHQDLHETSIQASTSEKTTSIEQAALASSIPEQARNESTNETVLAKEAMRSEDEASVIRASVEAAKKEAQAIRDQALQAAHSIQQQALQEASMKAKLEAQKIKQEALAEIQNEVAILKAAARHEAESIQQAALASTQEPNPIQRFLQTVWARLLQFRNKLAELRETRRQRRKTYKQSLLLQTNLA